MSPFSELPKQYRITVKRSPRYVTIGSLRRPIRFVLRPYWAHIERKGYTGQWVFERNLSAFTSRGATLRGYRHAKRTVARERRDARRYRSEQVHREEVTL